MSDWTFVVAAYGLAWVVLAGYAYTLEARLRGARGELDHALAERLEPEPSAATAVPHGARPGGPGTEDESAANP